MSLQITSGPATVLASGSATCFMGHSLVLQVESPVNTSIEFTFATDPNVDDVAVEIGTHAEGMVLHCINFDQADGRGSAQPVLIGELTHILVFLHFRVFLYGRTDDRTVHYTLYTVAKSDVAWNTDL